MSIVEDGDDYDSKDDDDDVENLEDSVCKAVRPRPHQCQHVGEAKQGDDNHLSKKFSEFIVQKKHPPSN